jgi:hypothetical protein
MRRIIGWPAYKWRVAAFFLVARLAVVARLAILSASDFEP